MPLKSLSENTIHRYYNIVGITADGWIAALEFASTIIVLTMLVLSFFVSGIFFGEFQ